MSDQKKIKFNETFYRALLESIDDGIYFVDANRNIIYWNKGAEKLTGFKRGEVIGTCCSNNILRHIDESGRELCKNYCPLAASISDGMPHVSEIYLHHKDGQRVPVYISVTPIRDASGAIIGAVEVFRDNSHNIAVREKLKEMEQASLLDELTKLSNRKYVEMNIQTRLSELQRYDRFFGVLFIDLDRFKVINDKYGHNTGDKVLKMVAATLRNNIRYFDIAGRWGGDEFVVLAEVSSPGDLEALAKKLCALVEKSFFEYDKHIIWTTVSIGVTVLKAGDTMEAAIQRADELMYKIKQRGGNGFFTE